MKKDYIEFMGLRLALRTKEKITLESKIGNPLGYIFNMMGGVTDDAQDIDMTKLELPPLAVIVATIHCASQRYEHGITEEGVMQVVDAYLDEDEHSVMSLFADVFMPLLIQAKYLPSSTEEE